MVPAIHETLSGTLVGPAVVSPTSAVRGTMPFTATGDIIGPSTFSVHLAYSISKPGIIKYTGGSATLTDSLSHEMRFAFTGSAPLSLVFPGYNIFIEGPVKGGAGTFKNAAGTFSGDGAVKILTQTSVWILLTVKLRRL
jgi:hypothetical protein